MAKWMAFVLANGQPSVPAAALLPALFPQVISSPVAGNSSGRASFYGYGFNVGISAAGRVTLGHSGAFLMGAATSFSIIPSADVGIVVLTNAWPIGVPETLVAQFNDLVQFGSIQRDWGALAASKFAPMHKPIGSLVGVARPTQPTPAAPLASYVGTHQNAYTVRLKWWRTAVRWSCGWGRNRWCCRFRTGTVTYSHSRWTMKTHRQVPSRKPVSPMVKWCWSTTTLKDWGRFDARRVREKCMRNRGVYLLILQG